MGSFERGESRVSVSPDRSCGSGLIARFFPLSIMNDSKVPLS